MTSITNNLLITSQVPKQSPTSSIQDIIEGPIMPNQLARQNGYSEYRRLQNEGLTEMEKAVREAVQDAYWSTTSPYHDYNQQQPSRMQHSFLPMNEGCPQSIKTNKLSTVYSSNFSMEGSSRWLNQANPALTTLSHQGPTVNTTGVSGPSRLSPEVSFVCHTCHAINHLQQQNYLPTTVTSTPQLVSRNSLAHITNQRQQPLAPHTLSPSIPGALKRKPSASSFDDSESTMPSETSGYSGSIIGLDDDNRVITTDSSVHSSDGIRPNSPNKNPFKCYFPGCTRRFARLTDVHRHIKTHDNVNTHAFDTKCDICHKVKKYTRMDSLYRHIRNCKLKYASVNRK